MVAFGLICFGFFFLNLDMPTGFGKVEGGAFGGRWEKSSSGSILVVYFPEALLHCTGSWSESSVKSIVGAYFPDAFPQLDGLAGAVLYDDAGAGCHSKRSPGTVL